MKLSEKEAIKIYVERIIKY